MSLQNLTRNLLWRFEQPHECTRCFANIRRNLMAHACLYVQIPVPTWKYSNTQARDTGHAKSSTRWVPRNSHDAKKGRENMGKGDSQILSNLYSPTCRIRDLSFQPLFCDFLCSKQFWPTSFKCPKESKVRAPIYSFILSPFLGIFMESRRQYM